MKALKNLAVATSAAALLLIGGGAASAHPLGNFTINRFTGLEISENRVKIHYVVDMAEIPAFQELSEIDVNADGRAEASELSRYAEELAPRILANLRLSSDYAPIHLGVAETGASLSEGQGGLDVLRVELDFSGALAASRSTLSFVDDNFANRLGWTEVVAFTSGGQGIASSSVPSESASDILRNYPKDRLSSPLAVTEATVRIAPDAAPARGGATRVSPGESRDVLGEALGSLVERDVSGGLLAVALLASLGIGALHALGPGHGKSIMAAYLLGTEGRARHAVAVGIAISGMHTASVVGLGLITLWASSVFPPERIYPWLSLVSGLVVLGLGLWLLRARVKARRARPLLSHDHDHGHDHHHDHDHGHDHHHHGPGDASVSPLSWRGLAALALSGGLLPSPSALVVLLGAVALHRVAFGLVLVAAFSVGLAGALTLIGVLVLRARDFATRRFGARTMAVMPLLSAAAILSIGLLLTTRAAIGL